MCVFPAAEFALYQNLALAFTIIFFETVKVQTRAVVKSTIPEAPCPMFKSVVDAFAVIVIVTPSPTFAVSLAPGNVPPLVVLPYATVDHEVLLAQFPV